MTHDNKFGMFIHWGLYAVTGVQDQVYARMNWPREKYEALIHELILLQCRNGFRISSYHRYSGG